MSLADQLEALEPAVRGPRCSAGLLLDELDESDRAALVAALGNPRKQSSDIYRLLKDAGYKVAESAIHRHRVLPDKPRRCSCHD
jgi:hypothetical protein